jgi:hypothetical protein
MTTDASSPSWHTSTPERRGHHVDDGPGSATAPGSQGPLPPIPRPAFRAVNCCRAVPRSDGGHRRYSRYQLRLAARVREIADQGTGVEAACRIVILEDQLAEALEVNARHQRSLRPAPASRSRRAGLLRRFGEASGTG